MCYPKTKFGFQPKPSTTDALFQITESNRFVQKKINGCILLDIEKAFDITHQSELFEKFSKNGAKNGGFALEWFNSNLTNQNTLR